MSSIKQVHLGLGRFFRGHQAVYTQNCIEAKQWPIAAVSLRTNDAVEQMKRQDCRYHVIASDQSNTSVQINHAVQRCLFLKDDYDEILKLMASEDVEIISFTITEKGYCYDFAKNELDKNNPEIKADLNSSDRMMSSIGLVSQSLVKRYYSHKKPVTLLSCDNVSMNGDVLRCAISQFLSLVDNEAAEWFESKIYCPNTMVDRIVPRVESEALKDYKKHFEFNDEIPIITEKFTQWCIEDKFSSLRPPWEKAGVEFVKDIEAYEKLKLRALNAAHSYLTYLGLLKNYEFVSQAIEDKEISDDLKVMFETEVQQTLKEIPTDVYKKYCDSLIERFKNPHLKHQLSQIAMDGSQKISQRWIPTIVEVMEKSQNPKILTKAVCIWIVYIVKSSIEDQKIFDPKEDELKKCFREKLTTAETLNQLSKLEIIPTKILNNPHFKKELDEQYRKFL